MIILNTISPYAINWIKCCAIVIIAFLILLVLKRVLTPNHNKKKNKKKHHHPLLMIIIVLFGCTFFCQHHRQVIKRQYQQDVQSVHILQKRYPQLKKRDYQANLNKSKALVENAGNKAKRSLPDKATVVKKYNQDIKFIKVHHERK